MLPERGPMGRTSVPRATRLGKKTREESKDLRLDIRRLRRIAFRIVSNFIAKEYAQDLQTWRQEFHGWHAFWPILFSAFTLYAFWEWAFDQGILFGLSYLSTCAVAILRGHIFTHPFRLILVAVALSIGFNIMPDLREYAWHAFHTGDLIGAAVIVGIIIFIWRSKKELETKEMETWETDNNQPRDP